MNQELLALYTADREERIEQPRNSTQYVHDGVRHRLWDADQRTSDAERAAWNVPPLAKQLRRAEQATRIDPPQPLNLDDAPQGQDG